MFSLPPQIKDAGVFIYNISYVLLADEIAFLLVTWMGFVGTLSDIARLVILVSGMLFGVWIAYLRVKSFKAKVNRQEMENAVYRMEKLYEIQERHDASDIADIMAIQEIDVLKLKIAEHEALMEAKKEIRNDVIKNLKP